MGFLCLAYCTSLEAPSLCYTDLTRNNSKNKTFSVWGSTFSTAAAVQSFDIIYVCFLSSGTWFTLDMVVYWASSSGLVSCCKAPEMFLEYETSDFPFAGAWLDKNLIFIYLRILP